MYLKKIHAQFIAESNSSMNFGKLPISAKPAATPIIPVERWIIKNDVLIKKFNFRLQEHKITFVNALFDYELKVKHHAIMLIDESVVTIKLSTKTIDSVTEIDREYAAFCDLLFRDIAYNS